MNLAAWRMRKSSTPASSESLLKMVTKKLHIDKKLEQYAFLPHWPEIVGKDIAAISKPERIIRGKVLIVRVIDPVWASELAMAKEQILDNLALVNAGAAIEDIRFVSGNPSDFSKAGHTSRK